MENDKNCLNKAKLFISCIKKPNSNPNFPTENKCKYLFDKWYKCMLNDIVNIK